MSKEKEYLLDFEEDDYHIDFASINTGIEGLDIDQALKNDGPAYDNYCHMGFCYYDNDTVFYAKKEGEKITDVAEKFGLNVEYILFVNNPFFTDVIPTYKNLISLGSTALLQQEISSYTPLDSSSRILSDFQYESERKAFGMAINEYYNPQPKVEEISTQSVDPSELSPVTGSERYSPKLLANKMHGLFPGEKNNLSLSEAKIDFAINLTARLNLIFTVSANGGVGLTGSVTDDRRFTTSVNWKLGVSGGVDLGIVSAEIGVEGGGSLNTFDQLNGSYESIDHFLAHFHNTFRIVIEKSNLDPKEYGLDDNSKYWKGNKKELGKGYTSVSKVYGAVNANAKVGLDEKLGVGGEYKRTKITRVRKQGIDKIGEEQSSITNTPDLEYLRFINEDDQDSIYEQLITFDLDVPLSKDLSASASLEFLEIMNDANKDNNGNYLNFQIQLPITEMKSTDGKISGGSLIDDFKTNKEGIVKAFSSIKEGFSSLSSLENELGRALVATVYHQKNASEDVLENILEYEQSMTLEINAYEEDGGYNIQYIRFWLNNGVSISTQGSGNKTDKSKKMSISISASSKVAFGEIVMENTLSYINTVYNQMMWEARDPIIQKSLASYLKRTKKERQALNEDNKMHDAKILEKLEILQQNECFNYSCTDWELYKGKHLSGIEGIKDNFQQQFNKEWVKLDLGDKMPKSIMGFDIHRHFGETKSKILGRLGEKRFKSINNQQIFIITISDFEELVLFKNYLENRSYASDYWK